MKFFNLLLRLYPVSFRNEYAGEMRPLFARRSACRSVSYNCSVARNLADVAKQAGVSAATVSRVLNGKPGISDATRAAVLTALDVIGYERPTHLRVRRSPESPLRRDCPECEERY